MADVVPGLSTVTKSPPKWRRCVRCEGEFCVGAPVTMPADRYRVTFCPFCGGQEFIPLGVGVRRDARWIPLDDAISTTSIGGSAHA
jgi:hypothetical protein